MGFFEVILSFLFPTSMIMSKAQLQKYQLNERNTFINVMKVTWPVVALIYVGHYFFVDKPLNLQPDQLWFNYRFGMAAFCLFVAFYYKYLVSFSILPLKSVALVISVALCYLQTRTIIWYSEVPYLYSFICVIMTSFNLRLTASQSIGYVTFLFLLQKQTYWEANLDANMIYSAFFVAIFVSLILASIRYFQVKFFTASENLFEEQRKNIEQNIEFSRTLKSFLPRKISRQLDQTVSNSRLTIYQAIDEVLHPKKRNIACLSCDIRGYTMKSKNNLSYVQDSVIPLTKQESAIVEDLDGIPRKIGDLLFCYFDSKDLIDNLCRSLLAGIKISIQEQQHNNKNQKNQEEVRKQIIISVGEALVGNIGGLNSSVEITAMGTPVNFLNRLETLVKSPTYLEKIPRDHIIISREARMILKEIGLDIKFERYRTGEQGLLIKDFEEVQAFYSFKASPEHFQSIENFIFSQSFKESKGLAS